MGAGMLMLLTWGPSFICCYTVTVWFGLKFNWWQHVEIPFLVHPWCFNHKCTNFGMSVLLTNHHWDIAPSFSSNLIWPSSSLVASVGERGTRSQKKKHPHGDGTESSHSYTYLLHSNYIWMWFQVCVQRMFCVHGLSSWCVLSSALQILLPDGLED